MAGGLQGDRDVHSAPLPNFVIQGSNF